MDKTLRQVVEKENEGYQFEVAEASFDLLVKKCAGTFTSHFQRMKYHVEVETAPDGKVLTEATVKLDVKSGGGADVVDVNAPNHLMFIDVDGGQKLVGAAYAFVDVIDTYAVIPFDSDLANWHYHPQFAGDGQTLHMLHIWFVPSSNGPFAGLNFWLPYQTAGVAVPSSCWMADDADALRIQTVSFALVPPRRFGRGQAEAAAPRPERTEMIAALDAAASADDHDAWVAAADVFIADLSDSERTRVQGLLGNLGANQMSSAERDAAGIAQPGSGRGGGN